MDRKTETLWDPLITSSSSCCSVFSISDLGAGFLSCLVVVLLLSSSEVIDGGGKGVLGSRESRDPEPCWAVFQSTSSTKSTVGVVILLSLKVLTQQCYQRDNLSEFLCCMFWILRGRNGKWGMGNGNGGWAKGQKEPSTVDRVQVVLLKYMNVTFFLLCTVSWSFHSLPHLVCSNTPGGESGPLGSTHLQPYTDSVVMAMHK